MLLFTSVICITIATPLIVNVLFADDVYINGRKVAMTHAYEELVSDYKGTKIDIYTKLNMLEDAMNMRVLIFDEYGNIVYQTLSDAINADLLRLYSIDDESGTIVNNFPEDGLISLVDSYRNSNETIAIRGSVDTSSGRHFIIFESPVSAIKDAAITINGLVIMSSIISIALGSIIVYFFSNRFAKPIAEINEVAKSVANMNFDKKVEYRHSNDEVETLAKNINFMSDQLEAMIYDLKVANLELKKDNDIRIQIDDMRKSFIANVSHELKTPLSLMQGYSEMLKEDIEGLDKDFYYDVIIDESRHMNELVKRLLDISSLENGFTKLNYERFDVSELALWIISKHEIIASEQNIKITGNLDGDSFVFADKLFIEQAITNYLTNALTYAESDILVEVLRKDGKVLVNVKNNGTPISDDEISKVWHSFFRADKARTRTKDKNFGLGLYIVKTIINAHNGDYGVYNDDKGNVTFFFDLPEDKKEVIIL